MFLTDQGQAIRDLVESTLPQGREIGSLIEDGPDNYHHISNYALANNLNHMGLPRHLNTHPITLITGDRLFELSTYNRCILYEAIGYVDPNLLFAAPGPNMSSYVVKGLGNSQQQEDYFSYFKHDMAWSCFAMSEPQVGSDAGHIQTHALKVEGGYVINGEKYFIGNGLTADIGVVFARTAPGPLGINCFVINPKSCPDIITLRLPAYGCRGSNFTHLRFDQAFVSDNALLGNHLTPSERFSKSAVATFDALRPCVAAIPIGIARAVVDFFDSHLSSKSYSPSKLKWSLSRKSYNCWLVNVRRKLKASFSSLLTICQKVDACENVSKESGLVKVAAVQQAESIINEILHLCDPTIFTENNILSKAFRDIKAFEYTEGTREIHWLNGSSLARQ